MSEFNETGIFVADFRKKKIPQISNLVKIHPVGAELFHDITKLIVAFFAILRTCLKTITVPVHINDGVGELCGLVVHIF
jgi:hypothetical protein